MGILKKRTCNHTMLIFIFFLALLFNVFTVTKLPIQNLAFMVMEWTQYSMIFLLGYLMYQKTFYEQALRPFYSGLVFFAGSYILIHFLTGDITVSTSLSHIILVLIFVFTLAHIKWNKKLVELIALMSIGVLILLFIQWLFSGFSTFQYKGFIRNSNIFGVFIACLVYFPVASFKQASLLKRVLFSVGIAFAIILIYVSSTRAALLLLMIALGARFVLILSRKIFYFMFHAMMLFNMVFVLIYGYLAKTPLFMTLNDWSLDHIGKRIFSGRQDIWEPALSYGFQKPLLGHYVNVLPKDYIADTPYVHAHNQYLQIFLESGLVGLVFFILLLFGIWKVYQKGLDLEIVKWSACFFLGILFYQSVEISLFFNIESIGLVQWFILSLGLGAVTAKAKEPNTLKI